MCRPSAKTENSRRTRGKPLVPRVVVNVLFGIFNAGEDFVIVNQVILVTKFDIYRCKLNGVKPVMQVLKTKIGTIHNIEKHLCA